MSRYVAKRFRFQNGEHHSVLKGPDGLPVHAVTLFLQKFRKRGRAANTIHAVCQCLALLHRELDANPRVDILGRLRSGQFLTMSELARLADVSQYPMKALTQEDEPQTTPQVVNLKSVRIRRSKAADEVEAVGKANHANRMRYMADYLGFLASYYAAELPRQQRQQLNLESAEALRTFKAQIPKVTKRAQMDAREGLSKEDQDRLLRVVHPASPDNPWERGFVRRRNWVIVMLLLATGMRSGELLGLQIGDIKQQLSKLGVLRRADAPEDPRRTPVGTKTNDRELELLPSSMRALLVHINVERHRIRAARRHPQVFVAQDGKPLSTRSIGKLFQQLRVACPGLPVTLTSHVMRHTWNERFSEQADEMGLSEVEEARARNEQQGWTENSQSARNYTRRHTRRKGRAVALKLQEDLDVSGN
ncbi:site-specific integrase [Mitsuaria sp. WAJ17]|uniref:tyrosine-type recombinase/integrase n=1 Tax=Mitsuaria sp. WAJ17 TaxID=2761452 RepID=UPI00210780E6|nr:site-specific integrase [Mitsuaria sp. WAJ17]